MLYTNQEINRRKKREEKIKNIVNIIISIMLVIVMTYNISLIIQKIIYKEKTPSFIGIKTYVVISGSMKPNIEIGDVVIVKKEKELKEGDIISYRKGKSVITHRITSIIEENGEKIYKTKGDNNNTEDSEQIINEIIEGKVIKIIPKIGNIVFILKNKITILIAIILLCKYAINSYKKNQRINMRHLKRLEYIRNKE